MRQLLSRIKKGNSVWDRVLSVTLVLALLMGLVMLAYTLANPAMDKFTEFYILGLDGKAINYPQELSKGETGKLLVGIVNREQETATYWIEIIVDDVTTNPYGKVTLEDRQKWEEEVSFTLYHAGENQKVEFRLFRQEYPSVYLNLHLWTNVR